MSISTFATQFSNWSDLLSLSLLFIATLVNGLDPESSLYGDPFPRYFLHFFTMATLVTFSVFRYILEGLHSAVGPREFLAVSVIYFARWLYLYYTLHRATAFPCRVASTAKSLRNLVTLRYGSSTDPERRGAPEMVIRRGARSATGEYYWRGKIQEKKRHGRGWEVHLAEEGMYTDSLASMGTIEYANAQQKSLIGLYNRIYETVMNVEGARESHVDWADFLTQYTAIAKTNMAIRAGATGDGDLAGVARRVAADACLYVSGKKPSRIDAQVELINACVYKAVDKLVAELRDESANDG